MKMHYDQKSDALYLRLDDSKIIESAEVQPGIVLDDDASNQGVGVEILRVKERVPAADPKHPDFKVARRSRRIAKNRAPWSPFAF